MYLWKSQFVLFFIGFILGSIIFILISKTQNASNIRNNLIEKIKSVLEDVRYKPIQTEDNDATKRFLVENYDILPPIAVPYHQDERLNPNAVEIDSDILYDKIRVLCWVLTSPKYHRSRAIHIKKTWGRRCNKLIFMSTKEDPKLPSEAINVTEGYSTLWGKSKKAMQTIVEKYIDDADWFIKADDDTYIIVENLRYFLKDYSTDDDHYFGCNFKLRDTPVYMSGGAGYVLSKSAIQKFVHGLSDPEKCEKSDYGYEDVEVGTCLKSVGVEADDSRDEFGRYRFLSFTPKSFLIPGSLPSGIWWWHYIQYPQKKGIDCCSPTSIGFHYVSSTDMYVFDFLLYYLRPMGAKLLKNVTLPFVGFIQTTTEIMYYNTEEDEANVLTTTTLKPKQKKHKRRKSKKGGKRKKSKH